MSVNLEVFHGIVPLEDQGAITVWIVEDNRLCRTGLADIIRAAKGLVCPRAVSRAESVLDVLHWEDPPDIVLMDIGLPGISGIEAVKQLRAIAPTTRVIMLTVHEENEHVFEAICAGASGYLLKPSSADQIVQAIRDVMQGAAPINGYIAKKLIGMFTLLAPRQTTPQYHLTMRETEILEKLVGGDTKKKLAQDLNLSIHTVDSHVRNIYEKLQVHSRAGAITKAIREKLV